MVEFSLILPLLLLVIGTGIDFMFAFREKTALLEASRVGARVGSAAMFLAAQADNPDTIRDTIIAVAQNYLKDAGYDVNEYEIAVSTSDLFLPTTGGSPAVRVVISRLDQHGTFFGNNFFPRCAGSSYRSEIRLAPSSTENLPRC